MKILFMVRLFYPHVGGVEKHVMEVGERLVGMGHKVTVVTESLQNISETSETKGMRVYRIPVSGNEKKKKYEIWRWLKQHRSLIEKADIVHVHDVFFWYLPFKFLYPRKSVYITFHGYEGYPISNNAIRQRRVTERLTQGNICVGSFIKKWYGTKPTYVTYGAVDLPRTHQPIVEKLSAGFIGRLEPITGVSTYLDAAGELRKTEGNFQFAVVGHGTLKEDLQKRGVNIRDEENATKFLSEYHFAFVSGYLTILEALAAKRPVIALYDNPLKEDYLRMTPYAHAISIVKNKDELVSRVHYLLHHPEEEKEMIDEGYTWAKEQSWDNLTAMYFRLWKK